MNTRLIIILFGIGVASLCAKVTNVTPNSEKTSPPEGTINFSESSADESMTPLAELLRFGRGVIEFTHGVTYTVEEEDKEKVAADGSNYVSVERSRSSFPFESGRYRVKGKFIEKSATRIFTSKEGWLVIQRGHQVRLIPIASIKAISGWIPDRAAAAETKTPAQNTNEPNKSE